MYRLRYLILCLPLLMGCRDDARGPAPPDEDVYAQPSEVESRDRHVWQKPGLVIDALGDIEEKVIADIGAGEGFFARRLAPLVDRVIAVEIDERWINYLDTLRRTELPTDMRSRLEPRLATESDPRLEPNEVDVVLFVNTLYLIEKQEEYLAKLIPALRENGRVVIVDWKKRKTALGPEQQERIALFRLEQMLQNAGFRLVSSDDLTLDYQYIVIAEKTP